MKSGLEAHSRAYQKETPQAATGLQKSSPGPLECPENRLGRREDSAVDSRTRCNWGATPSKAKADVILWMKGVAPLGLRKDPG